MCIRDRFWIHVLLAWLYLTPGWAAVTAWLSMERADADAVSDEAATAAEHERAAREQIAFYMSTPAYRTIVDLHGWGAEAEQLSQMARRGEWAAMGDVISDRMLEAFAISGKWAELPGLIQARYAGRLLDRVALYLPYTIDFTTNVALGRYADIARFVGLTDSRDEEAGGRILAEKVRELAQAVGQPLRVADFGIDRADFRDLLPKLVEYAEQDTQFFTAPRIPESEELAQMFEYVYEGRAIDF